MTKKQRTVKKLKIIGIVLFFFASAIFLIFGNKNQSCFNGIYDIGEEGVDCGGVCENKCPPPGRPPNANNIKIEWVKFIKDGKNNYDLIAKLSNNNEQWGVSSVNYRFDIYDNKKKIIGSRNGETYIMPKGFLKEEGIKYVIEDNFNTHKNISKVNIELFDFNWSEVKDTTELQDLNIKIIEILDKKHGYITDGSDFYYASGITKNISIYSFYRVDLAVVLFDKNDNPIAVAKTDQWTMKSGDGWIFEVRWTKPFSGEVYNVDYNAQTNVFNLSNFMEKYGTGRVQDEKGRIREIHR